jgi:hypothetical protein
VDAAMADPKSWNPWHGCRRYSEGFGGDRPCHYEWIRRVSDDCTEYRVNFTVNAIGSHFVKDGRMHLRNSRATMKNVYHNDCVLRVTN